LAITCVDKNVRAGKKAWFAWPWSPSRAPKEKYGIWPLGIRTSKKEKTTAEKKKTRESGRPEKQRQRRTEPLTTEKLINYAFPRKRGSINANKKKTGLAAKNKKVPTTAFFLN